MSDAFIRWYRESATTPVLAEQVELFAKHGIQLRHPALGAVMAIDVEGNNVPLEREELDRLLGLRISSITMNWWFSENVNVVDEYSYEPLGCEIQTFWLDGLTGEEAQRVETALTEAATRFPTPTRALVIDRRGISDPDDWDSIILYEGQMVPEFPDRVIVQGQVASRFLQASPELLREEGGSGLSLLTSRRLA
ncbi:hypothetical protein AB0F13_04435 [Streptomyces sp. NPDC026206]|uniref:hypothetical protein n=1 Tax=Streptomyces sp. NPDC026206 TaxID=3157089 RepID=UPI0033CAD4C1